MSPNNVNNIASQKWFINNNNQMIMASSSQPQCLKVVKSSNPNIPDGITPTTDFSSCNKWIQTDQGYIADKNSNPPMCMKYDSTYGIIYAKCPDNAIL